uniref:Uncharacterized protein n=1 Tax=Cacopsylla melanoneura TaxID=428564 RepID=A0A8D8PUC2_9HEMI
MSCNPSSSTHCSSGSQNKETFPLENNEDRNRESAGHQELIPICNKFQFGNPQMKGFTISTISDVYHRSGAEIITCFSIFDANFEDFNGGCALTFPNIVRDKICGKDLTTILNVRSHGVLGGTYHCGGIRREYEHRSQTIYRIFDEIRKIVKENTNWGDRWGLSDDMVFDGSLDYYGGDYYDDEEGSDDEEESDNEGESDNEDYDEWENEDRVDKKERLNRRYVICDYNNIPVLFYTDDFIDLEQGNEISFRNVPINFIIGNHFIAIPLYINETFRGYAVAQQKLWCMAYDQAGVAVFTTFPYTITEDYREFAKNNSCDPNKHPPYLVGNFKMSIKCTKCERNCLDEECNDGIDRYNFCVLESRRYFRPR